MRILHIDCSIRGEQSISRQLSQLFVSQLTDKLEHHEIQYLDLGIETPSHPTALFIKGNYTHPTERTEEMVSELAESEALIEKMHWADVYIIGMPMYNWSVPSNFKTFIDNVVRIGRTFLLTDTGFQGLLNNKKVFVINTRGVDFALEPVQPMDQLLPYLKTVFFFMGLTEVTYINVFPVKFAAPDRLAQALVKAKEDIAAAVQTL